MVSATVLEEQYPGRKENTDSYLTPEANSSLKWVTSLNDKAKTLKPSEEKNRRKSL